MIRNYPHCPDCGVKLKNYKSKKCQRCAQLGKKLSAKTKDKLRKINLGKKHSAETCRKISEATRGRKHSKKTKKLLSRIKKGIKFSEKHKRNLSKALRGNPKRMGENNPAWKGGITPNTKKLRHSVIYKEWRNEVFERDDYTCQMCGVSGVYLEADHIKSWSEYPELRFEVNNGRTLCRGCHYFVTWGKKMK